MRDRIGSRLTYANVVATIALFLGLGGASAFAAYIVNSNADVGPDTISGHKPPLGDQSNIIAGSVNGTDLANNAVNSKKVKDESLTGTDVLDGSLTGNDIAGETITGQNIEDNTIGGGDLTGAVLPLGSLSGSTCDAPASGAELRVQFSTSSTQGGVTGANGTCANNGLTVPGFGGVYVITATLAWNHDQTAGNASTGDRRIRLVNLPSGGGAVKELAVDEVQPVAEAGKWTQQSLSTIAQLNGGDTVELYALQDSGNPLAIQGATLSIVWASDYFRG